jgi:hypothetical protein
MNTTLYLKPNVQLEPLIDQWYAWAAVDASSNSCKKSDPAPYADYGRLHQRSTYTRPGLERSEYGWGPIY